MVVVVVVAVVAMVVVAVAVVVLVAVVVVAVGVGVVGVAGLGAQAVTWRTYTTGVRQGRGASDGEAWTRRRRSWREETATRTWVTPRTRTGGSGRGGFGVSNGGRRRSVAGREGRMAWRDLGMGVCLCACVSAWTLTLKPLLRAGGPCAQ